MVVDGRRIAEVISRCRQRAQRADELLDAEADTPNERAVLEPGVGEMPLWSAIAVQGLFDPGADRRGLVAALDALVPDLHADALAFREIAETFEQAHPGHSLRLNFAGSGVLLQQIARGAPVDVLATADQLTMDQAEQQQLLATGSRRNFAGNTLVLITPVEGKAVPGLDALLGAGFERVAVSNHTTVQAATPVIPWPGSSCGSRCRSASSALRMFARRWITSRATRWTPALSMPPTRH